MAGVYVGFKMAFSTVFYLQLLLILFVAITIRVCVSMWRHSGEGKPPLFGYMEVHRHWMEVTVNLPFEDWYVQSDYNDLDYWGFDSPPLTAYHMMIIGKIAQYVNSSMVAMTDSHGIEDPEVKFFMRATVLAMDVFLFLPATVAYFMLQEATNTEKEILHFVTVLAAYPGLLLVDNGLFHYNNVTLGLLILATLAVKEGYNFISVVVFCCMINYKQVELYHSVPFFAYFLGRCIRAEIKNGVVKLLILTSAILVSCSIIWSPFLQKEETAIKVVQRLLTLKREHFEDKVANFWCTLSVLINFKDLFSSSNMAFICSLVTSVFLLPSILFLLKSPSFKCFHYALINTSLVFYLFSFNVHQQNILLAAIPSCFVMKSDPLAVFWFLFMSIFSLLPMLFKDGLLIPTFATICIYWMSVCHFMKPANHVSADVQRIFELSVVSAICLAVAAAFIPPPKIFPDIFNWFISIYAFGHFALFAVYFHLRQFGTEFYFLQMAPLKMRGSSSESDSVTNSDSDEAISVRSRIIHQIYAKHRKFH